MTLSPNLVALIDRLTDPVPLAVQDVRDAIEQLSGELLTLKTATDRDGDECAVELWSLAHDVQEAVDALAATLRRER